MAGPETNGIAQAVAGIMVLVISWRFAPIMFASMPVLSGDTRGRGALRAILTIALSILLAFAAAVAVGVLAQRP